MTQNNNSSLGTTTKSIKKWIAQVLFLSLLSAFTLTTQAQQADFKLKPIHKLKIKALSQLQQQAGNANSIRVSVADIQESSQNYLDLYYTVSTKLYYLTNDVAKKALRESLSLSVQQEIYGKEALGQTAQQFNDTTVLSISPYVDHDRKLHYFNKANVAPLNLYDLDSAAIVIDLSSLSGLDADVLSGIYIELFVEIGRYNNTALTAPALTFVQHNANDTANQLKVNEAALLWEHLPQPASYELEWVHIPLENPQGQDTLNVDFTQNAVRVQTDQDFMPMNMLYGSGILVARARAKRPMIDHMASQLTDQYEYGAWSMPDRAEIYTLQAPNILIVGHTADSSLNKTNWQYSATYANESRKKEVIQYFDGSQRNRQSVTVLNDFNKSVAAGATENLNNSATVIAQENYYDYNGQVVLQSIASPVVKANNIGFQSGLNQYNGSKLSKADYDHDSLSNQASPLLDKQSKGAAHYFSDANSLIGQEKTANAIPDAEGYVYQRTAYLKDGSGRLKTQYGLGAEKATDESKNTRFAYAKPTSSELEWLFGTNVGLANFYKKDISIDPNGVMSMNYVDHEGRTVASSIAGEWNSRAKQQVVPGDSISFNENLINTGAEQFYETSGSYELLYPIFVPSAASYDFEYGFDIQAYNACSNVSICFDCRYELLVQVINQEGELILEAKDDIVEFTHGNCQNEAYALDTLSFVASGVTASLSNQILSIELEAQQQYTIVKKLSLLRDQLEVDAALYLQNGGCDPKTEEDFIQEELARADFEACDAEWSNEQESPCQAIEDSLRADFTMPNGAFVKGVNVNAPILDYIFNKLVRVPGCRKITDLGLQDFKSAVSTQYNISPNISAQEYQEEYIDFLLYFHPTYCQLDICHDYYSQESLDFDERLKKSNSIEAFAKTARRKTWMNANDTLYYDTNLVQHSFKSSLTGDVGDLVLLNYDQALAAAFDADGYKIYFNPMFRDDSIAHYAKVLLPKNRRCNNSQLVNFDANFLPSFFNNYGGGCPTASSNFGISDITRLGVKTEEERWKSFVSMYLSAKNNLIEDVLSSLVCFNVNSDSLYDPIGDPGNSVADSLFNCRQDTTYVYPSYVSADVNNFTDPYTRYHHFTGMRGSWASQLLSSSTTGELMDSLSSLANDGQRVALEVYRILLHDSLMLASDSAFFVSTADSSQLVCDPYGYLAGNFSAILIDDPLLVNLSNAVNPFLQFFADTSGTPTYNCTRVLKESYTCAELSTALSNYSSIYGAATIPSVVGLDASNVLAELEKQRKLQNWLNVKLGLSLSFDAYHSFLQDCTFDGATTLFGDTVSKSSMPKILALQEAWIKQADRDWLNADEATRMQWLNDSVNGGHTVNAAKDYLLLGEANLQNNQYQLYYLENQQRGFNGILASINDVFGSIKSALRKFDDIEDSIASTAVKLGLNQYSPLSNNTALLIDRAYRYANGTVWVRLLAASDSSYYNDFYFHYEVDNQAYLLNEVDTFLSIQPVALAQEDLHYVRLSIDTEGNELLARSANSLGQAVALTQVALADQQGSGPLPLQASCEDRKYEFAQITGKVNYQQYLNDLKKNFENDYVAFCTNQKENKAFSNQYLNMNYPFAERQFTLYYYDQADNLVMTVPPEGIDLAFAASIDSVRPQILSYRNGGTQEVLPQHSKRTNYKYNAANQIIRQSTPNGDTTLFWYDKAGRLAFSQNAEQQLSNHFSYTRYDAQSRIVEVGVVPMDEFAGRSWESIHSIINLGVLNLDTINLDALVAGKNRIEVSKTFYDHEVLNNALPGFAQRNLRSRVATQAYYSSIAANTENYNWEYASHYSYDATGNVTSLVNDFYQNGTINNAYQRFKRIDYAFDVVSGNVLQVYYQLGREDAFYHRYEYDAENRITKVETSTDGIIWDQDAEYEYYLHGPLARTVLGEHQVQGIDYAYTIDGWLKTINAGHHQADLGADAEKANSTAADAFGFALQYHQNDYRSVGNINNSLLASNTGADHSDLYNGNIAAITKHNQSRTIGTEYKYDQLNRIKSMGEKSIDNDSLKWEDGLLSDGNSAFYEYDKNGNLLELHRVDGNSGAVMDKLQYNYLAGKDQLSFVNDTVSASSFPNDIDNQATANYKYDKIGNLVTDSAEGICDIRWYANGKLKRIIRDHPSRTKADLFFEYDANGNRVKKTVSFEEDQRMFIRSTYYVRDAQGNVMTTYEERDCDFYEANDSTGLFYYQYTENFGHYTQSAIDQSSKDSVLNYLTTTFAKKEELCEEAHQVLRQIPFIRDSIAQQLNDSAYIALYPDAIKRLLNIAPYDYANEFHRQYRTAFQNIVNERNEVYIQHLIENNLVIDFYETIDSLYNSAYGKDDHAEKFMQMNQNLIQENFSNSDLIIQLFEFSSQYPQLLSATGDHAQAIANLKFYLEDINLYLSTNSEGGNYHNRIRQATAHLVTIPFAPAEIEYAFSETNLSLFYNAKNNSSPLYASKINNLLYYAKRYNNGFINGAELTDFQPARALDWKSDTEGELLKYYLQSNLADSIIYNAMFNYLDNAVDQIYQDSSYFASDSTVHAYVKSALLRHWNDSSLKQSILKLDSLNKAKLYLTEDLDHLAYYFKKHHPVATVQQNYYYDSLGTALSGLAHCTPIDYAQSLVNNLGVSFGPLGGCTPHNIYLLAEQHSIYGSSRLGLMDAKKHRKEGDKRYTRKLGAKNYELSDHLGNVVATISDKKLHPQELLVNGSYALDSSLGYQAELTGRYDYYPFGMEIMSRSGDFNTVDYTTDELQPVFKGLWNNCGKYYFWSPNWGNTEVICTQEQNVYGDNYVSAYVAGTHPDSSGAHYQMRLRVRPTVAEFIPDIDTAATYKLEFFFSDVKGRTLVAHLHQDPENRAYNFTDLSHLDGAAYVDAIQQNDKLISMEMKGSEITTAAYNGEITFEFNIGQGIYAGYKPQIELDEIVVSKIIRNSTVPLAQRSDRAYDYGFNGMERDDATKGSGNEYTTEFRQYDPRLGKWLSRDPLFKEFPWQSPYVAFDNNPIYYTDPNGLAATTSVGDNDDEWNINVETNEKTWVSSVGGDEVQFINFVNNEGNVLGSNTVEGEKAYVGQTRDGWVASKFNLWENLNLDYNAISGYEYDYSDLKMRYWVFNSSESYSGFADEIRNNEARGVADPITGKNFWNYYGHTLGNLVLMDFYVKTSDGLLSAEGVNGLRWSRKNTTFRNFYISAKSRPNVSNSRPLLLLAKNKSISSKKTMLDNRWNSETPTFNQFRSANKGGPFKGYKGRGTGTKAAWHAYKQLYIK